MSHLRFDRDRFSVDQITLSELEERSGVDFGKLKDFDDLATAYAKGNLGTASLRLPMTGGKGGMYLVSLTRVSTIGIWRLFGQFVLKSGRPLLEGSSPTDSPTNWKRFMLPPRSHKKSPALRARLR